MFQQIQRFFSDFRAVPKLRAVPRILGWLLMIFCCLEKPSGLTAGFEEATLFLRENYYQLDEQLGAGSLTCQYYSPSVAETYKAGVATLQKLGISVPESMNPSVQSFIYSKDGVVFVDRSREAISRQNAPKLDSLIAEFEGQLKSVSEMAQQSIESAFSEISSLSFRRTEMVMKPTVVFKNDGEVSTLAYQSCMRTKKKSAKSTCARVSLQLTETQAKFEAASADSVDVSESEYILLQNKRLPVSAHGVVTESDGTNDAASRRIIYTSDISYMLLSSTIIVPEKISMVITTENDTALVNLDTTIHSCRIQTETVR